MGGNGCTEFVSGSFEIKSCFSVCISISVLYLLFSLRLLFVILKHIGKVQTICALCWWLGLTLLNSPNQCNVLQSWRLGGNKWLVVLTTKIGSHCGGVGGGVGVRLSSVRVWDYRLTSRLHLHPTCPSCLLSDQTEPWASLLFSSHNAWPDWREVQCWQCFLRWQ